MKNLYYFLKQMNNSSLSDVKLCEGDCLLFSQLSYMYYDDDYINDKIYSFNELYCEENTSMLIKDTLFPKKNKKLLKLLSNSRRYRDLKVGYLKKIFDEELEIQFFALTIIYKDYDIIVFEGTDATFLGWKEDFNMAYMAAVPSQKCALSYLNYVAGMNEKPLYITGHSKGGNMALYAFLYANEEVRDRIKMVYNFDGPGFKRGIENTPNFEYTQLKHKKYSVHDAVIGVIMHDVEDITYVKSSSIFIFQHDPFNWHFNRNCTFKKTHKNTINSRLFRAVMKDFLDNTPDEDAKRYVELVFKIIAYNPRVRVLDLLNNPFMFTLGLTRNLKYLTPDDRSDFKALARNFRKSLKRAFKQKVKARLQRIKSMNKNKKMHQSEIA